MADDEFAEKPAKTDFHGRKRELLKQGLEQGELTWDEIRKALPAKHLTSTELEVLIFTCKNLGIDVKGHPQA